MRTGDVVEIKPWAFKSKGPEQFFGTIIDIFNDSRVMILTGNGLIVEGKAVDLIATSK